MPCPRSKAVRSVLFLLSLFLLVSGCGDDDAPFSLNGVWPGEYGSVLTITDTAIDFGFWGGEIVTRNDAQGCIVFRYTNAPAWAPEQANRFNKLDWARVDAVNPGIIRYSEGYALEAATTNATGGFIAWPTAESVAGRTDIFAMYTFATNL